jgi:hypothetical protein
MKFYSKIGAAFILSISLFSLNTHTSLASSKIADTLKQNIEKNRNARNEQIEAPEKEFVNLATTSIANLINIESRIRMRTNDETDLGKDTESIYNLLTYAEGKIDQASSTLSLIVVSTSTETASTTHLYATQTVGFISAARESLRDALLVLRQLI